MANQYVALPNIPIASPSAGHDSDGVVIGHINATPIVAAFQSSKLVKIEQVIREDMSSGQSTLVDLTTAATDATTNDFAPFGEAANMSVGDAFLFYVTDGKECDTLKVRVETAGVGTWTVGIQEWDATAENWLDMSLTDPSNGFKIAGYHTLTFTHVKKGSLKLRPTVDAAKHVWHRFVLKTLTSATTAPKIRIWAEADTEQITDITDAHKSGTWSVLPAEILPAVDQADVLVHAGPPMGEDITVTQAGSTNYTCVREYLATDGTWKTLTDVTDPSSNYSVTGTHRATWPTPSDWTSKTYNGKTGWVSRCRISAVTTQGPVAPARTQLTSRAMGSGNALGQIMPAGTYTAATLRIGENRATGDTVLQLSVPESGASATVTIPTGTTDTSHISGGKISLSSSLSVSDGQTVMVSCLSGGVLLDMELQLH